jgi:hypothetical protein
MVFPWPLTAPLVSIETPIVLSLEFSMYTPAPVLPQAAGSATKKQARSAVAEAAAACES